MKVLLLAALLMPLTAAAGPEMIADGSVLPLGEIGPTCAPTACLTGSAYNANTIGYYNLNPGVESYAVLIDAGSCPDCDQGFTLARIWTLLRLNAGAAFQLSAALADVIDDGNGCYAPGEEQARSDPANVSGIATTGGYFVKLNWDSPCIEPGRPYFLIFRFTYIVRGVAGPYIDNDGIAACRSFRNTGSSWVDLSTTFAGDPFFWADTECCSAPVVLEGASWGSVKSLFR